MRGAYPWERPLGAFPQRRRHDGVPRLGAARASRSRCALAARELALERRGLGVYAARGRGRRTATTTATSSTAATLPDPCSRWQPEGCAARRAWSTPARSPGPTTPCATPALGRPRALRAARRHVHAARARSTAAIAHLAALRRARRHRDRADAGRRVPRRRAAGATTASTCAPRSRPTAAPTGCRGSSTPPRGTGSRVILDVVYNHVGASGVKALRRVRPVLHRQVRDALGQGDQLRRRATADPVREWVLPERRAAGCATSTSTACASTRPRDLRLERPAPRGRAWRGACTRPRPRALRDRRERH